MQEPEKLPQLLSYVIILLTVLIASFGCFCYLAYGSTTGALVTFNFPESKITSFVRLFYALGVFFTFPIIMFPVFQLFEGALSRYVRKGGKQNLKRCALRFAVNFSLRHWYYRLQRTTLWSIRRIDWVYLRIHARLRIAGLFPPQATWT